MFNALAAYGVMCYTVDQDHSKCENFPGNATELCLSDEINGEM